MSPIKRQKKHTYWQTLLTTLIFIVILYLVFHKDYQKIIQLLRGLSVADLLLLPVFSLIYVFLDAASYYVMVKYPFPGFHYHQAVELTLLGIFANVSTSTAGTVPLQSYYLYQQGVEVGSGIGTMVLESVFHKLAVLFYALFIVLTGHQWLTMTIPECLPYLGLGFLGYVLITAGMALLCSWSKIGKLLAGWLSRLPQTEKWAKRK